MSSQQAPFAMLLFSTQVLVKTTMCSPDFRVARFWLFINPPPVAAGLLMSILFLVSGIAKFSTVADTQAYMEAYGVPGEPIYPAAAFEISSGVAISAGLVPAVLCWLLAGWCILTAAIFHVDFGNQIQQIMFMKNLVMAGGFLVLAGDGWCV
jgi:putative oxidoreductase